MDKTELLEKFFKYVVITIILGIVICSITYLYNAQKMDVSFVKDVYSILFSIFAPLFAIFLFTDWKDQKKYELEKQYAESTLRNIFEINKFLNSEYFTFSSLLGDLDKNYIARNYYFNRESVFNLTDTLYKLDAEFKTLNLLSKVKIPEILFSNIETNILLLSSAIDSVEKKYKAYYEKLPKNLKEQKNKNIIQRKEGTIYENKAAIFASEMWLTERLTKKFKIEMQMDHQGNWIPYEFTYKQFKERFDESYSEFIKELLKKINV
ncbi:hypothetical protein [Acinetobacter bereziniae]|uniref:hypothetical protein n=1 Tax=Acinetobacter bereziniae TaxID=106648 RepID=UPI0019025F12|nr:hypothetical protein [Acinetobacter bereziniae]MBJ8445920.1 hypothetical protein [Acinetobacter bereziniae]